MTTTNHAPSITQESSSHLDASIQRKQDEILVAKQRVLRLQVELSNMKKRKASMKTVSNFREQLAGVFGK